MRYWGFALCHADDHVSHGAVLHDLLDLVELADVVGLDGWFFPEHHGNPRHSLSTSPNLLIAAASSRTHRIRLGTMVAVVPFHHPLRLAEEIRLLGLLTGGRLDIGLGPGGFREHVHWGIEPDDGPAMFDTGVSLLRRLLREGDFQYETKWWRGFAPPPVPAGGEAPAEPPLWLATVQDRSVETAARWGLNCDSALTPVDVLPRRLALYRETWEQHHPGTRPGTFAVVADVTVAENREEALALGEEFHARKLARFQSFFASRPRGFVRTEERRRIDDAFQQLSFAELIDRGLAICGSVDDCVEQVQRLCTAGVDALTAWMPFGELKGDVVRRSIRLFCEEVIPGVERKVGPRSLEESVGSRVDATTDRTPRP
jgi:alkanesulfonate monooxygenase SsuD/methylene tetrahydromethanopterin reductase-like flavin-dependent oxidoreductase (luciferase family)